MMELILTTLVRNIVYLAGAVIDMSSEEKLREKLKDVLEPEKINEYIKCLKLSQQKDFGAQTKLNEMNKIIENKVGGPQMESIKKCALNFQIENSIRPAPYISPRLEK